MGSPPPRFLFKIVIFGHNKNQVVFGQNYVIFEQIFGQETSAPNKTHPVRLYAYFKTTIYGRNEYGKSGQLYISTSLKHVIGCCGSESFRV